MNKLGLAIVLAAMVLAGKVDAQVLIVGSGGLSCGTWVTDRQRTSYGMMLEIAWVEGYITGLNAGLPSEFSNNHQVGAHLDLDGFNVWLDNYCTAHPLDHLIDATDQLYTSARSQNK